MKQNKQFYDVDLLKEPNEQERHPQPQPHQLEGAVAPLSHTNGNLPVEGDLQKVEGGPPTLQSRRRQWYKTRNGIIGIVVVLLIVLGAAIGGAVGGTRGKSSNKDSGNNTQAPIASNSNNGGTAGIASSTQAVSLTAVPTRAPTNFNPAPTGAPIVSGSGGG